MIRIAICDDSPEFLQQTKQMLAQWTGSVAGNISVELFEDADSLLLTHSKNPFDIIFLDIVMPLLNGIEAAQELRLQDKSAKIVFLTSSPEFAVESYTVKASNYLLKPVQPVKLFACLDELAAEIQNTTKAIVIKGVDAIHRIALSDIEYVEAQLKRVVFFLKGNRTVEAPDPFYTYEAVLPQAEGFFKCHRSYIVNIHHIENFSHSQVVMRSGMGIPISRSCQKTFEDAYFSVVFGKVGDTL